MRILGCTYEADLAEWVYICSCHCNFCDTNVEQLNLTFNTTGLKGHFHPPCRRYHKGSGVFLLVEVGSVDDIAVDLFISRDDGLQKHNCDGSH